jgi:hypothetical protein
VQPHRILPGLRADHTKREHMTNAEDKNIDLVRTYLNALQSGEAADALRNFFTDDVRQIEMPNQLNQRGQESDLEHILQRSQQGLQVLERQQYESAAERVREDQGGGSEQPINASIRRVCTQA